MGAPITWRTIMGQSLADASRPLEAATRTFNAGFENLRDVLKERQATENANAKQIVANNTNDALNQVYALENPEAFQAAQTGGLFQRLMGQGAQIDQNAVRSAIDGRLAVLQQRNKAGWEYTNAAQDQKEAPIRDEAATAIARKDLLTANIILNNAELRNKAPLAQALANMQRQIITEGQADEKHSWQGASEERAVAEEKRKEELFPGQLKQQDAQLAQTYENIASSRNNRETSNVSRLNAQQQITQRMIDTLGTEILSLTGGSKLNTEAGYKTVTDFISKLPDKESQEKLTNALGTLMVTGKYNDLNAAHVVQALQADYSPGWWNTSGENLTDKLDAALNNVAAVSKQTDTTNKVAALREQQELLKRQLFQSLNIPLGGTSPKKP